MIALLNHEYDYYISGEDNIKDFLISYANYIGLDMKVFNILVSSGEMSDKELVAYINNRCYASEEIVEIYELGKKLY